MFIALKKALIVSVLVLWGYSCLAQQGNNWYFGKKAGISFNSNPPSPLTDGAMDTEEGCASISDSLGTIIFYTDGVHIYNRLHQVMLNGNGLMGHISSSQSAIIVPKPGSRSLYYVFTADAVDNLGRNGYRYSIVDLNQDGGLGDVSVKNILLAENCSEKLTASPHANGIDVWILGVTIGDSAYRAYRLTCNGLDTVPVISRVGIPHLGWPNTSDPVGVMKISPDGKKMATTRIGLRGWEIFDFDNATGKLSHPLFIPVGEDRVFGVEFSPSSKLVYVVSECCFGAGTTHQYQIEPSDSASIVLSHYKVDSSYLVKAGIQQGPDGKIYIVNESDSTLNVIRFPDRYGQACNFEYRAVGLAGRLGWRCLPTFYSGVIDNRKTDFTYAMANDCHTLRFEAVSQLPTPLTWSWNFGDGTKSTGQFVTHSFPLNSNSFPVILTVRSEDSCNGQATKMKAVSFNRSRPKANFGFHVVCSHLMVDFSDSSFVDAGATIVDWQWIFGEEGTSAQKNCSHTFSHFGQYPVRLIVTSSDECGSKDTISKMVSVIPAPVANFNFDQGCLNTPMQFFDSSYDLGDTINSWTWTFDNKAQSTVQNPQHIFTTNGSHPVSVKVQTASGCIDSLSQNIFITPKPVALFNFTPACINTPIFFMDHSTIENGSIVKWRWKFDEDTSTTRNSMHTFTSAGKWNVSLVVQSQSNCPSDTLVQLVTLETTPQTDFNVQADCGNKTVLVADNSSYGSALPASWAWSFGDSSSAEGQNQTHTYSSFGSYNIQFSSRTANGCMSDTLIKTVSIKDKPKPDFRPPTLCLLDGAAKFINSSSIEDGSDLSFRWNFGDFNAPASNESLQKDPSHLYTAAAHYHVTLLAQSSNGCVDSAATTIAINGAVPKAQFKILSSYPLCSNLPITIEDSSTVDFGNITLLKIFWGDGDSTIDSSSLHHTTSKQFAHQYKSFGGVASREFVISLHAFSGTLCENVIEKSVTLQASPDVIFYPLSEVCNEAPSFIITQATEKWGMPGFGIFSGDGIINSVSGLLDPKTTGPGFHTINYSFRSPDGCLSSNSQTLVINPTPSVRFSFTPVCLPQATIQFTNFSSAGEYSANQLLSQWNFTDPNASLANPNQVSATHAIHTFNSLDTFQVKLSVSSPKGCVNDSVATLVPNMDIYSQPTLDFSPDPTHLLCQDSPTTFTFTSDSAGSFLTKWFWDFGDGDKDSNTRKPSHLFSLPGIYVVRLQIENGHGCLSNPVSKIITIESTPLADFNFDTACLGHPIKFIDASTNHVGNIVSWDWNFDDGFHSFSSNPSHSFSAYHNYNVRLRIATKNGCSASVSKIVSINQVQVFAGKDMAAAINEPIQLQAHGAAYYEWSPTTGLSNPKIDNPIATLHDDQIYIVKGFTTDGCFGFDTVGIKVFSAADFYVPTAFTPNRDGKNDSFGPICVGIRSIDYFIVYDRWGEIVFSTKNEKLRWDGKVQGKPANSGAFVWMIQGQTYDGRKIRKQGTVILIR